MSGPVIGIDLGTTNSVVAVVDGAEPRVLADAEGYNLIPSVVSFHPNGEILVGRSARDRRLLDARNTVYSVKRLIGRPFRSPEVGRAQERFPFELAEGPTGGVLVAARNDTYTLSEISAFVLRQVRTVAEQALGTSLTRAVVTVPANFNELQRSATKAAGRVAGLDVLRILNEPTAAALAYGYGRGSKERVAIFDLGGGTFDLTILELSGDVFEVLATAGDTYLGGDDVDVLVADQMADAFLEHHRYDAKQDAQAYERLRAAAEWAKCQLSAEEEVQLRVEELAYGEGGQSLDLTFGLSRQMLESMAQPLIARAFDVCEDAMRVAGIRPTQLDNVILVGGSTRMPLVQGMVAEYFGRQPLQNIDPDLVVAKGAAIQGTALTAPAERRALGRVRLKKLTQKELQAIDANRRRSRPPAAPAPRAAVEVGAPQHAAFDGRAPIAEEGDTQVRGSPLSEQPPAAARGARPGSQTWDGPVPAALEEQATAVAPAVAGPADFELDIPTDPGVPPVHEPRDIDLDMPTAQFGGAAVQSPAAPPPAPAPMPPPIPLPSPVAFEEVAPAPTAGTADAPPAGQIPVPGYVEEPPGIDEMVMPELPLLLDVTPHSLRIETVGGFSEVVIKRNAAIPVEQTRIFSTAQDSQDGIRVRICQGESRRLEENQGLGVIELQGLRPAPRGQVKIDVTFIISADGTLGVRARDAATGNEQIVHIKLVGAVDEDEIQRMRARQQQLMGRG